MHRRAGSTTELREVSAGNSTGSQVEDKAREAAAESHYFAESEEGRQGLEGDLCLPRPCRFVARRLVLACELAIRKAFAKYMAHGEFKSLPIVHVFAVEI